MCGIVVVVAEMDGIGKVKEKMVFGTANNAIRWLRQLTCLDSPD